VKDYVVVNVEDDPRFIAFLRRIRLKEMKHLVTGFPRNSFGLVTENNSQMDRHETLDQHVASMEEQEPFRSLMTGGWEEQRGVVNLKVTEGTTELLDEHRVVDGDSMGDRYKGSSNVIFSAPQERLSKMYQDIKQGRTVEVGGLTVKAMSPAFRVNTKNFLPIYALSGTEEGRLSKVPSSVVRDYKGAVFIVPVHGQAEQQGCVTVFDEEWEVRESIVRLKQEDNAQIELLKGKGFHEIEEFEEDQAKEGEIVMVRHQLARVGEYADDDDEESIFRSTVGSTGVGGSTASVALQNTVPSLHSTLEETEAEGAQRKKMKHTKK
jgi:hypothetical protein